MMLLQYGFFSFNKGTILMLAGDKGDYYAYVGARDILEIFVLAFQLCYEHKTNLKYLLILSMLF